MTSERTPIFDIDRRPRHIIRQTTDIENRCNLPCDYCFIGPKSKDNLPSGKVAEVLQASEEMGLLEAYLVGAEPTMHPDLEGILEATHILDKTGSTMITNGTRLTPDMVRMIRDSNLHRVAISIDGPDAESHNSRRGKSFEDTMRGLHLLQETGKTITVISIAHQDNKDRLLELSEYLAKNQLALQHHIVAVSKSGDAIQDFPNMKLSPEDFEKIQKEVDQNRDTMAAQNLDLVFATYWQGTGKRSEKRNPRELSMFEFKDQQRDTNIIINVSGDVRPASASWHREFVRPGVVGNIYEDPVLEIFQKTEKIYREGNSEQMPRKAEAQRKYEIGTERDVKIDLVPILPIEEFDLLKQNLERHDLELKAGDIRNDPQRFRAVNMSPKGIFVLFDKTLSNVMLLREDETNLLQTLVNKN